MFKKEIKFRAKTSDGRWVYGHYFQTPLTDENSGTSPSAGLYFLSGEKRHCISNENGAVFVIDINTLGQYINKIDITGKEVYEGDVINVYDTERDCICNEWEDCEGEESAEHKEHGEHIHKENECEQFICSQTVEFAYSLGYFCDEDTGDFCPPLGADEIAVEVTGNIHNQPSLI